MTREQMVTAILNDMRQKGGEDEVKRFKNFLRRQSKAKIAKIYRDRLEPEITNPQAL